MSYSGLENAEKENYRLMKKKRKRSAAKVNFNLHFRLNFTYLAIKKGSDSLPMGKITLEVSLNSSGTTSDTSITQNLTQFLTIFRTLDLVTLMVN